VIYTQKKTQYFYFQRSIKRFKIPKYVQHDYDS